MCHYNLLKMVYEELVLVLQTVYKTEHETSEN